MSPLGALGIGLGLGFAGALVLLGLSLLGWLDKRRGIGGSLALLLGLFLLPPLIGAIAMPDFKTAIALWVGFPVGWALGQAVTLPLGHLAKKKRR